MNAVSNLLQWGERFVWISVLALALSACGGDDGDTGPQGPPGSPPAASAASATSLDMTITGVTVNSPPVVEFSVTNQDGDPVGGLTTSDLRFTVAKLMPGTLGNPSVWQNYILTTQTASAAGAPGVGNTRVQATRENNGTLVDNGDGTYSYTFATDITNVTCPAPCIDAQGNPLDVSYQPGLTHRLAIQTRGNLPPVNALYTFRPSDGATTGLFTRDIVKTESCNECHNMLEAHDERIEAGYCVTCHNPGSTDPDSGNTVDFKVMIHKIHRGEDLPSVNPGGGEYAIWGFGNSKHDFSDVVFPQDMRNCTKCHDGSDPETPQGDNWKTQLSMQACGSCHDDIDFSKDGSPAGANDPNGHPGGIVTDNSECVTCHAAGRVAGSVEDSHVNPAKVASAKFKYNILAICGTAVDAGPLCAPGATPSVRFSVSDPTGGTHGYGSNYNILSDPEFTTAGASFNILTAWDTRDYSNDGGTGSRPSRANSVNVLSLAAPDIVDNGGGEFTVAASAMDPVPATAVGSGAIAMEGHPRGQGDPTGAPLVFDINVPVKGEVAYFRITDATPVPRRVAVDLETKCDKCHDQLSLHGNNRAENAQLCVLCHNPRGSDVGRRPKAGGIPDASATLDGKREESIDLKRLIHAIHAAQRDDPATPAVEGHGFREKGIVIYGFGGSVHDFGHVRFPGILSDCTTCHNDSAYELTGTWETPTQNGVLGSSVETVPNAVDAATYATELDDQTTDLTISPTAAVCSACHDSAIARAHMETVGGAQFNVLQSAVSAAYESCAVCHGPGRSEDVKVVHGVE